MDCKITEISISVKMGRLVVFYCIDPHVIGARWIDLTKPKSPEWIHMFGDKDA